MCAHRRPTLTPSAPRSSYESASGAYRRIDSLRTLSAMAEQPATGIAILIFREGCFSEVLTRPCALRQKTLISARMTWSPRSGDGANAAAARAATRTEECFAALAADWPGLPLLRAIWLAVPRRVAKRLQPIEGGFLYDRLSEGTWHSGASQPFLGSGRSLRGGSRQFRLCCIAKRCPNDMLTGISPLVSI